MTTIDIRPLTGTDRLHELEDLQRIIWKEADVEVIPGRAMHAIQHNGGLLLGAIDTEHDDKLVGFIFAVIGTVQGLDNRIDQVAAARLQLYSTIMGVLPGYQGRSIGYRLKLAQREYALRLGIRLVTWTYDPLESRNGWLNIGKLGAICHQYLPNFHGDVGGINAGLPTDRFYVEWWVTGNRVRARVNKKRRPLGYAALIGGGAGLVNEAAFNDEGLPVPPAGFAESESNIVMVEIPPNFQQIKQQDMALARRWREHTGELFSHYFAHDFIVTDFARHQDDSGRERTYYVLTYQHA